MGYLNHRYRDDQGRDVRTAVVDPGRGPHITWAFQSYATGTWSMSRFVSALNDRGMTTKAGPNTPTRKQLNQAIPNHLASSAAGSPLDSLCTIID